MGAAGLAEHQAARQPFHTCGELAFDGGEEPLGGGAAEVAEVHVDRGERRPAGFGHDVPVVEANEGHVIWHVAPGLTYRVGRAPGYLVVPAEDRVHIGRRAEQGGGGLAPPFLAPLAVERPGAGHREPGLGEHGLRRGLAATNPRAREYIWSKVKDGYYKHGVRAWWLDACEPEFRPEQPDNLRYHLGPGLEVGNIYPLLHAQGFFDGMTGEGEDQVVLLCRSAWAGSQRYGAAVWSGDIDSSFESLRRQIPAGLNIGLTGIPWWTTDIGGFKGGDVESPSFRELLVRWFQFGVFSPLCRMHGDRRPSAMSGAERTGAPNEVWSFGAEVYEILRRWLGLREHLRPYVMDTMRVAHAEGLPAMRPLFLEFPDDETCWEIADEFLLGADLLVAPVVTEGAREREVYLPAGADWRDAWTGACLSGGQRLTAAAPLDVIPVYVRDGGSVEPFGDLDRFGGEG